MWIFEKLIFGQWASLGSCFSICVPNLVQKCWQRPKLRPKIEIQDGGCPPSWIFQNLISDQWVSLGVDFPSGYQIRCKNVDRWPNYGQKSKFKMAAVRHLGILISPYRTTHEVFSLGYISLSNFVLIRYIVLKMGIWFFFAEMAWNAYLRPKISVLGVWTLRIIDHRRDPQNAHLHLKPRVMSTNSFDSVHICDL